MSDIVLQVDKLRVHYGKVEALHEVGLKLERGSIATVIGPNGAGKSTLLRCLYRSYLPTAGHAYYYPTPDHLPAPSVAAPVDLARAPDLDIAQLRKHEIGFVTQFLRARPRVTVLPHQHRVEFGGVRATSIRLIEDHYFGQVGHHVAAAGQTTRSGHRAEILLEVPRVVRLVVILREQLEETIIVRLIAALERVH